MQSQAFGERMKLWKDWTKNWKTERWIPQKLRIDVTKEAKQRKGNFRLEYRGSDRKTKQKERTNSLLRRQS